MSSSDSSVHQPQTDDHHRLQQQYRNNCDGSWGIIPKPWDVANSIKMGTIILSFCIYTSLLRLQNLMGHGPILSMFFGLEHAITSYNPSLYQSFKIKSKNLISNLLRIASHLRSFRCGLGIPKAIGVLPVATKKIQKV